MLMDMYLVGLPTRRRMVLRALRRGAWWGSGSGAAAALVAGIALACSGAPGLMPMALALSPFGAAAGLLTGMACGLTSGAVMSCLRPSIAVSALRVRLAAAAGAALWPAAWVAVVAGNPQRTWLLLSTGLTLTTFCLAFGGGAAVFYDLPGMRLR
jgi:hypothetical protein